MPPNHTPLPCALAPLPGESLAGLLLRLSHRNEQPPQRLAVRSGLLTTLTGTRTLPAHSLLDLPPSAIDVLCASWRLTPDEARALTLRKAAPHFPDRYCGWILTRASRYCPECLAGDDSPIQNDHGGAWQNNWRLPITFACARHHRMLNSRCPHCGELAHTVGRRPDASWLPGRLVPSPNSTLHPAQCRTVLRDLRLQHYRLQRPCGGRLDTNSGPVIRPVTEIVALQQRLLAHSRHGPADHYFDDARLLYTLSAATWPQARSLTPDNAHFQVIDDHLDRQHHLLTTQTRFTPTLPTDARTCASLFLFLDTLLSGPELGNLIEELFASPRLLPRLCTRLLDHPLPTSLRIAATLKQLRSTHLRPAGSRQPAFPQRADRRGQYEPRHVPQRLPDAWFDRLRHLQGISELELRRDAAVRLVLMVEATSRCQAGRFLGLPYTPARTGGAHISAWLKRSNLAPEYFETLGTIADLLAAQPKTDYLHRRARLQHWSIPAADWADLVEDVQSQQRPYERRRTPWTDAKRVAATVYVWAQVTSSEPRLHPTLQSEQQPDTTARDVVLRHLWWMSNGTMRHLEILKSALDRYALDITTRADT